MLKRMLFAAAITGLVAGATLPLHSTPADAASQRCFKAAKAKFPGADYKFAHAYRKDCSAHWRAYKTAQGLPKRPPNGLPFRVFQEGSAGLAGPSFILGRG